MGKQLTALAIIFSVLFRQSQHAHDRPLPGSPHTVIRREDPADHMFPRPLFHFDDRLHGAGPFIPENKVWFVTCAVKVKTVLRLHRHPEPFPEFPDQPPYRMLTAQFRHHSSFLPACGLPDGVREGGVSFPHPIKPAFIK